MVHSNNTASYEEHKKSGKAEAWRKRVFDVFAKKPMMSFTDREVMEKLGVIDCNLVRPEITRLLDDHLITEAGKTQCNRTKKTVRHCTWSGKVYFQKGNKTRGFMCLEK